MAFYKVTILVFVFLIFLMARCVANDQEPKPKTTTIYLYENSKRIVLDSTTPSFKAVLLAAEDLLKTADSTSRQLITEKKLSEIKEGRAVEIIYANVQSAIIPFNSQTLYYTSIVIPLTDQYVNGSVFFRGIYARTAMPNVPDYHIADMQLGTVTNSKGISYLISALNRASNTP